MSKDNIYLIDMRFNKSGHYLDDLKEFYYLSDKYNCCYLAPVGEKIKVDERIKAITDDRLFYLRIFLLLLFNRKDKVIFLSCSYIPLFLISCFSFNFNYMFRIHSMPIVRVSLYKKIIKLISRLSNKTIFLDHPVKDYFIKNGISDIEKSVCVIGRTLKIAIEKDKLLSGKKFNLTFIGAMNSEKDLQPILTALCRVKIEDLSLTFLSKGIDKYEKELKALKAVYEDTRIVNRFLSREEYDYEINRSDALILPYKNSYGVRFSAVLNDALKEGKKVLTIRLPQFEFYYKKYNACYLYKNEDDVIDAINKLINSPPLKVDALNEDYSKLIQKNQLKTLGL